jgi:hypothetical protein
MIEEGLSHSLVRRLRGRDGCDLVLLHEAEPSARVVVPP